MTGVGPMRTHLAQQVAGVAGLAGQLEAGVLQEADHRRSAQSGARGDHDPDVAFEPCLSPRLTWRRRSNARAGTCARRR
jgi:hypothetical protein